MKKLQFLLLGIFLSIGSLGFSQARVQVIHNSADAAAATVDVWLNDVLLLDNFSFRTASPFVDAPAGEEFTIAIQGPESTSAENPIWSQNYTLAANETYVLVANGIVSPTGYDPVQPFDIYVNAMGQEQATDPANTDVLVFHGSTDAPTVDVVETGVGAGTIIDDFVYGDFAGYLGLGTADYVLEVRDETGMTTVAAYSAPLATLGLEGQALTVLASGFLNPANNSDGEAFGLYVALASGGELVELPLFEATETARVQVIHNSADAAAATVDVWLNDVLLLDNFSFRNASPFVDAPAGEEFTIAIQGPESTSAENPIWSQNYTLAANETYVLVANGIVSPTGYDPVKPFDIYVYAMGQEQATDPANTDVLVFHGSTDAPTVDVVETGVGAGTIIDDFVYGDFAGYLGLATADYVLEVRDETGTVTVAAYSAPLATLGLEGQALTVIASGFLNPANNSDGEAFGLYVALASGGALVELPLFEATETARVQVIHNAADAAAATVDVWLNDVLLLDNFSFRTASPFVDAPAGEEFTIAIQGPESTSAENPIWSQNYTLAANETYVLVANGIVSPTGYDPVQPFDIYVNAMGQEQATDPANTDVLVFHGSTDAPTVDVVETGVGAGTIIDDFVYGDFAGYLGLGTADYVLEVRDETGMTTVAAYSAPLATLGLEGQALTVLASGFLNPANNSDGEAFGLYVALASGGELVELPLFEATETARVQVIHNSADAAAATVDVWLNDVLLLDNFSFRNASPFVDAPAGEEFTIAIQGPESTSAENPIWSQNYTLAANETYVLVANGIVSPTGYDPVKPFDIYVYAMGQEEATDPANTDVLVFHGSTDAPTVDVVETGVGAGTIIDDFVYGDFAGYLGLATADYVLEVRDETGTVTVAAYNAPLATLGLEGQALTVLASGFLNPANNSDGASFGLFVALAAGGALIDLPVVTSLNEQTAIKEMKFFPNPARDIVNLNFDLETGSEVSIDIFNLVGAQVYSSTLGNKTAGLHSNSINVANLKEGMYLLRITSNNSPLTKKFMISR